MHGMSSIEILEHAMNGHYNFAVANTKIIEECNYRHTKESCLSYECGTVLLLAGFPIECKFSIPLK